MVQPGVLLLLLPLPDAVPWNWAVHCHEELEVLVVDGGVEVVGHLGAGVQQPPETTLRDRTSSFFILDS